MIKLSPVPLVRNAADILYDLLKERPAVANISHKTMPTWNEHCAFIASNPYLAWYIIQDAESKPLGAIYLTRAREIGIFIFRVHHRKGYAAQAVSELLTKWPGTCYANIAPGNTASIAFFEALGARHIQNTYQL